MLCAELMEDAVVWVNSPARSRQPRPRIMPVCLAARHSKLAWPLGSTQQLDAALALMQCAGV